MIIEDPKLSRRHAELSSHPDAVLVTDLDSTNGTFARDLQVLEVWLEPGLEFVAGETTVRFRPVSEDVRIEPTEAGRFGDLLGTSRRMREVYALLEKLAPSGGSYSLLLEFEVQSSESIFCAQKTKFNTQN